MAMTFLWSILLLLLAAALVHADSIEELDNLPPNLRPLTPIKGTNLFLNLPYKWHDFTKPACYVSLLGNAENEVSVLCSADDQKYYETNGSDWMFVRTHGKDSTAESEYDGTVGIRSLKVSPQYLLDAYYHKDIRHSSYDLAVYPPVQSSLWNIRSDSNDINHLQLQNENYYVVQHPTHNYRSIIALESSNRDGFPYTFVPTISLEAKMSVFKFVQPPDGELASHTSKKALIDTYVIDNDSSGATISRTIKVSEKVTNEFAWGFSESIKIFHKIKGTAGIPFLAKGEVETGFEFNGAANQNWKNSVEKLFEMTYVVNVKEKTRVTISGWYDLIKDISMDFTVTTEVTGKTVRMTVFNDIVEDTPATGEMIRNYLSYSKFDGEIVSVEKNSVIVQMKGTMTASVGVRGRLAVDDNIVVMAKD